ncbi:MAG: 30S ribosomal protein S1 [Phototrophicales bacterium]|nr:MAG: 30S ribosomal protein S1 [Phototrophicales bacterium]RMG73417.1 MAG: S1 RNA-binding domain-containing protein [Chloroflexota bacterium]
MTMDMRQDLKPAPPTLDEGYWQALLSEGEHAITYHPDTDHDPLLDDEAADSAEEKHPYTLLRGVCDADWEAITQITQADQVIDLKVVGYNRGGLLVEWRTLRGFVPASQLLDFPSTSNGIIRRNALLNRVGDVLRLRVIELNPQKNRLILSERAAQADPGERENLLTRLSPGDIVRGFVTNLCEFGAFVDLGGLEGLIHISELSWGRVGHPASMLQRGQEVEAYVLGVDQDQGRIALSIKRLRPDPWKTVEERYTVNQIVEGVITNVVDFGAFACIEEGLEGLIHVSELAEGHFLHPRNVVSEGQHVRARILTINGAARRLGLSLRLNE